MTNHDISRLPTTLADVLRLRAQGATDVDIALLLGVEPEGVEAMIAIAEAKLRRIRMRSEIDHPDRPSA